MLPTEDRLPLGAAGDVCMEISSASFWITTGLAPSIGLLFREEACNAGQGTYTLPVPVHSTVRHADRPCTVVNLET